MKENLGVYYDQTSDFQQEQFNVLRELILEKIPSKDKLLSLLDIGSGTGARTLQCFNIFPQLKKITAIEPNPDMLAVAKEKYADPRITYVPLKAEELSTLRGTFFDGVISNWSLHWVSDKKKMMSALSKMTHPGSYFMFSTCEALPDLLSMIDSFVRQEFALQDAKSPFFYLNASEWKNLLATYGWEIIAVKAYPITRELADAKQYLQHWLAGSTSKFMYEKNLFESSQFQSHLIEKMIHTFPSKRYKQGICFKEDVLFIIAHR
jgi:ubiquinone/menaquinone biosynthesis C-methylase UbiE